MIRAVFVTSLQEMSRRLTALVFILLLPLAFYLVRIDVHWQAIRFLSIGIGWAVATLSLFTFIAARNLNRRLVVAGASPSSLFAGRLTAVLAVGLGLAVIYFGVVALTLDDLPGMDGVLLLVVTVLIGAPLGAVVSLVIVRELEGALALLALMAVQLLVDPDSSYAGLMPLWSTREFDRLRPRRSQPPTACPTGSGTSPSPWCCASWRHGDSASSGCAPGNSS